MNRTRTRAVSFHASSGSSQNIRRRAPGVLDATEESEIQRNYSESKSLPTISRLSSDSAVDDVPKKSESCESESSGTRYGHFKSIALTPRFDSKSSFSPDFTRARNDNAIDLINTQDTPALGINSPSRLSSSSASAIRGTLNRGLNFISFNRYQSPSHTHEDKGNAQQSDFLHRSQPYRTDADMTICYSDRRHPFMLLINDKVTHKWPKPEFAKRFDSNSASGVAPFGGGDMRFGNGINALEEGGRLGMDSFDQWTGFKWCLMVSVMTVFTYGLAILTGSVLTWFRTWTEADVMYVADGDILILITLSASILVFTAVVGFSGTILNSRAILAIYTLLLWPSLISVLVVGYASYKRYAFKLDHKLNLSWSQFFTPLGRLLIQGSLKCCGYYSPSHEATPSNKCYPRTVLQGCKGPLYRFEKRNLGLIWRLAFFFIVPMHLVNLVVALLCSNHVTKTFGKGMTPKMYRLTESDLQKDRERMEERMRNIGIGKVREPDDVLKSMGMRKGEGVLY
ncbi:tetraspanin tsp2 family [Moniliophthora roreri MCA 2997]|uniref:Tetraspanin tsp2 family n=1 Tax=Moniliophthora roreri (strain MCA 2997) TaxID=1381753 RepID=V2XZ67_MONRO|nr:tetraspanin tsp2 family [Moniliophthora roreri MCA 2997]